MNHIKQLILLFTAATACLHGMSQSGKGKALRFHLSTEAPASRQFTVSFNYSSPSGKPVIFRLPAWTPGYYQMMHYADFITGFSARYENGDTIRWEKTDRNGWKLYPAGKNSFTVQYHIRAERNFVASNFIDSSKAFVSPAGVFLHPENQLTKKVQVRILPFTGYSSIVTGMDAVKGEPHTYEADDFDVLYDSPILMGSRLERFPPFYVKGIPHYFVAHDPGDFPRQEFMNDLQKIVAAASDFIGDIPYPHYTFIAIGPGGGGIEHLNSTAISFGVRGSGQNPNAYKGNYSFLAHEYFHHYNAKRIRPIELGPFDYNHGSKTNMLWVAEGITVYYEHLILRKAGIKNTEELLNSIRGNIASLEQKPGKKFQSAAQASYRTWQDGPFGGNKDSTISYYEKGPVLAALLDFKIRHETKNKQSLNHLMRVLYYDYYKKKNRGFTEKEFRKEAEKMAGTSLEEFFRYVYTVTPIDYKKYFGYAGLEVSIPEDAPAKASVKEMAVKNDLQQAIFSSWSAGK